MHKDRKEKTLQKGRGSAGKVVVMGLYGHEFIDHAETYVNGTVPTNWMENFWALLKRSIKGPSVSVELLHLFRYLDERSFRFNERKKTDSERFMEVLSFIVDKQLTYKELTGGRLPAIENSRN